jgi:prepilin peptidase CpaA
LPVTSDGLVVAVTLGTLGTGAVIDMLTRRIPNHLTLLTAATGVVLAATGATHVSVAASLAGLLLGMLLMMPGHLLGATGAGDVKLLGAAGALLGVQRVPAAFLYTAVAGGILALLVAISRRRFATTLRGLGLVVASPQNGRRTARSAGAANRFAYGPAIAIGCTLVALGF